MTCWLHVPARYLSPLWLGPLLALLMPFCDRLLDRLLDRLVRRDP